MTSLLETIITNGHTLMIDKVYHQPNQEQYQQQQQQQRIAVALWHKM